MTRRLALLALVALAASAETPRRIVSASPSITEMLYAVGVGDRVVGVTEYCHYPPEVRGKAKIGSYMNPSLETILAMKPDLAVVLEEHAELRERLERVGLPVLAVQHNDLAGVYRSLQEIGEKVGSRATAARRIADIQANLDRVRERARGLPSREAR